MALGYLDPLFYPRIKSDQMLVKDFNTGQIRLVTKYSLGFPEVLCLLVHTDTPEPVDTKSRKDKIKLTEF